MSDYLICNVAETEAGCLLCTETAPTERGGSHVTRLELSSDVSLNWSLLPDGGRTDAARWLALPPHGHAAGRGRGRRLL